MKELTYFFSMTPNCDRYLSVNLNAVVTDEWWLNEGWLLARHHNGRRLSWPSSQWRYNGRDSVSNHQPHDYLLNGLFRRRSKKTSKLRVSGLCAGNSPVNSPHKWPVTWKMFPFDDVIMWTVNWVMHDGHIVSFIYRPTRTKLQANRLERFCCPFSSTKHRK